MKTYAILSLLIVALVGIVMIASTVHATPTNLLPGEVARVENISAFEGFDGTEPLSLTNDSAVIGGGTNALAIAMIEGSSGYWIALRSEIYVWPIIEVEPEAQYIFSAWLCVDEVTGTVMATPQVLFYGSYDPLDNIGGWSGDLDQTEVTSTPTRFTYTFNVPSDTYYVMIGHSVEALGTETLYVSGLQLELNEWVDPDITPTPTPTPTPTATPTPTPTATPIPENATIVQLSDQNVASGQLVWLYHVTVSGMDYVGVYNTTDAVALAADGNYVIVLKPDAPDFVSDPAAWVWFFVTTVPMWLNVLCVLGVIVLGLILIRKVFK